MVKINWDKLSVKIIALSLVVIAIVLVIVAINGVPTRSIKQPRQKYWFED